MSSVSRKQPEEKLLAAVYNGDTQSVASLLNETDSHHPLFLGGQLLCAACSIPQSNSKIVQQLLEFSCEDGDAEAQVYKDLALYVAASRGDPDIVQVLLDRGADILGTNRFGVTPLHSACRHGNTGVVEVLVKRGAPVDYKDSGSSTPLYHAVTHGHTDIVKILIKAGCDLDTVNDEKLSCMDQSLVYNHRDITAFLLKGGCQIEKAKGHIYYSGHYCNTALYSLIQARDIENVRLLIECGHRVTKQGLQQMLKNPNSIQESQDILGLLRHASSVPRTLKSLCRITVRRVLINNRRANGGSLDRQIERLGIPLKLRSFMSMRT